MLGYRNVKSSLKYFLMLGARMLRFLHSEDTLVGKPDRTYVPSGDSTMSVRTDQCLVMSYTTD